uniref:Uncharacterized protein n=1 Tax=Amphimedon queenslandica TaxID=400682 RepID=A0A1X7V5N1_AMPQE
MTGSSSDAMGSSGTEYNSSKEYLSLFGGSLRDLVLLLVVTNLSSSGREGEGDGVFLLFFVFPLVVELLPVLVDISPQDASVCLVISSLTAL